MRNSGYSFCILLIALVIPFAQADVAPLVEAKVLVELSPGSQAQGSSGGLEGGSSAATVNASYVSTGGFAVTSREYIDIATVVFDMGGTSSVASATLTMPIEAKYALNGSIPMQIYAFSDNGRIEVTDYSLGFAYALANLELGSASEVRLDVTGITNAMLKSGRYVGFKAKSAIDPDDIPSESFPAFKGVKFGNGYRLEFTPGAAPKPAGNEAVFDGFTMVVPAINVPSFGVVNVELQLQSVNQSRFTLTASQILSGGTETGPARKGLELLDCAAFQPPGGGAVVASGSPMYSINSGVLSIPGVKLNGVNYSANLTFQQGSSPMRFALTSLTAVNASAGIDNTVSALGGGTVIEATQDFIPLCHGWVLIGDTNRNRLVERNVISGETAGTYAFGTKPNQLMLDEANGVVYLSVHPEAERLYKLTYATGKVTYNRILEAPRQYSVRDMALGEAGNIFAILYDADQLEEPPPAESGLWLGLLDTNANIVTPSTALADPIRIEYDRVFKRVFLTTESNLATFDYNPATHALTFVTGTDIEVGSDCSDFAISPDGKRLAYPCPAGNKEDDVAEPHVGIHDLDPVDYKNPDGEWYLGSKPVSAVFNAAGTLLIATNGTKIFFFDVVTHLLLQEYELGLLEAEVVKKIRLSKDGKYLLILMSNTLGAASGKMYWMPMPDIQGTPL